MEACEALQPHLGTPGLFRTAGSVARIRALKVQVPLGRGQVGLGMRPRPLLGVGEPGPLGSRGAGGSWGAGAGTGHLGSCPQARVAGGEPCLGLAAPCDVAALLKRFLRELPEPLVPPALQEPLCQAQREPDPDRAPLTLLLTGLLPPAHACALRYLCCFLRRVAARCVGAPRSPLQPPAPCPAVPHAPHRSPGMGGLSSPLPPQV